MSLVESFLTKEEENSIVDAIRNAEKKTSGEIRVHLESYEQEDFFAHAVEVFYKLGMQETLEKNGVLLYVAVPQKQFVVYGDEGIHKKVGDAFWQSTKDIIIKNFKAGKFAKGLTQGIEEIGEVLKNHFPWQKDDTNELSDEISKS